MRIGIYGGTFNLIAVTMAKMGVTATFVSPDCTEEELNEEIPDSDKGIEERLTDRDTSLRIHTILHSLEEPYKEVFQLRTFGELSFAEIGSIFGKTENWARVTYHRARLKIKERMDENEI